MKKITVLLDTSPLRTGSNIRGIGTYTRLLRDALSHREDVIVIPIESKDDMKKVRRTHPSLDPATTLIHYPFFDLFFATLPIFRKFKTVVTIHDVIPLKFPHYYRPGRKGKLRFYQQAFALQRVDSIITDSQSSKKDIGELLTVKNENVHVVYLAAPPLVKAQSEAIQEKVRRQKSLPKHYILYVGDINYNKNLPQLIKALKFIPDDIHLVCVGKNFYPHDIPEWKWIETQIALSDVSSRVHFVTDLAIDDTEALSAIYSAAIAYIQPSLYEGFGLPILEAMQAKSPVVASNNSSIIEVSGEHAVLVEPTAEGFAEGIKTVLGWSKTHRQAVIKDAYTWSQTFQWAKVAEETVAIYKKTLNLP